MLLTHWNIIRINEYLAVLTPPNFWVQFVGDVCLIVRHVGGQLEDHFYCALVFLPRYYLEGYLDFKGQLDYQTVIDLNLVDLDECPSLTCQILEIEVPIFEEDHSVFVTDWYFVRVRVVVCPISPKFTSMYTKALFVSDTLTFLTGITALVWFLHLSQHDPVKWLKAQQVERHAKSHTL